MIKNLLKSVFEREGRQRAKVIVHSPNNTKNWRSYWRCSNTIATFIICLKVVDQ